MDLAYRSERHDDGLATSHVYSLLARLWLVEVDHQLAERLTEPALAGAFQSAGGILPEPDRLEELAADYCQLFLGPKHPLSPYQSVWQKGQLVGRATESTAQFARLLGYRSTFTHPHSMDDHLGLQLDVMACAVRRQHQGPEPTNVAAEEIAGEFFRRHLSWPGRLLTLAADRAETDFYRGLMRVTAEFLASERAARVR